MAINIQLKYSIEILNLKLNIIRQILICNVGYLFRFYKFINNINLIKSYYYYLILSSLFYFFTR